MNCNMGALDRIIRIVLALVLGWLYFADRVTGTWGIVLLVIGIILVLTGLVGYCGLYRLLKISTCKPKKT